MVNFTAGPYIIRFYYITSGTRILIDHVITALFGWFNLKQPAVPVPISFMLCVFLVGCVFCLRKVPLFAHKYVTIMTII